MSGLQHTRRGILQTQINRCTSNVTPSPRIRGDDVSIIAQRKWCSIHLLIGVNAPQPLLLDPAVKTVAGDVAPALRAVLDLGHDAGLQLRRDRRGLIGAL